MFSTPIERRSCSTTLKTNATVYARACVGCRNGISPPCNTQPFPTQEFQIHTQDCCRDLNEDSEYSYNSRSECIQSPARSGDETRSGEPRRPRKLSGSRFHRRSEE